MKRDWRGGMSKQSAKKVLDRILHYPHKEKGCSYICGPHLEPCVMVRAHDGDCECKDCDSVVAFREKVAAMKAAGGNDER